MKTLSKAVAMASLLSAGVMGAQVANAEVEYNAGLATTYLWRGYDLGGTQFSAGADYSHDSGLYVGTWVSGGDTAWGNEYDLYAGYTLEMGDAYVDLYVGTYTYADYYDDNGDDAGLGSPGENSETTLTFGYMDASVAYTMNLQNNDSVYIALGYSVAGFDFTYGMNDMDTDGEYSHFDVSYGLTDALAVTVSQAMDDTAGIDEDTIVVMSYSLPL